VWTTERTYVSASERRQVRPNVLAVQQPRGQLEIQRGANAFQPTKTTLTAQHKLQQHRRQLRTVVEPKLEPGRIRRGRESGPEDERVQMLQDAGVAGVTAGR